MTLRASIVGALILALVSMPAVPDTVTDVRSETGPGWSSTTAFVEGAVVSYAAPRRDRTGRREIILLVDPKPAAQPEPPREGRATGSPKPMPPLVACADRQGHRPYSLLRFDPIAGTLLPMSPATVSGTTTAIDAVDLDGDGLDELVLFEEDGVALFEAAPTATRVDIERLRWRPLHPRIARHPALEDWPYLALAGDGELVVTGRAGTTQPTQLAKLGQATLPRAAILHSSQVVVQTPVPTFAGSIDNAVQVFAIRPEIVGRQRLKVTTFQVDAGGTIDSVEAWVRFPEPEELIEYEFLVYRGKLVLLTTTRPSERLNLFGEKRLRLFPLAEDRTRLGRPPLWTATSRANLWQNVHVELVDATGDGTPDLTLGYWKGLKDDRVVLDVYVGNASDGGGAFAMTPKTTAFDVKKADRSFVHFGSDLNGDGNPDLLIADEQHLRIHKGIETRAPKSIVNKQPVRIPKEQRGEDEPTVVVGVGPGVTDVEALTINAIPQLLDIDGDGRSEILVVTQGQRSRVQIVRIDDLGPL